MIPTNIKMYPIEEAAYLLDSNNRLQIPLIKEGCKICEIPCLGGGIVFVSKKPTLNEELDELKIYIAEQKFIGHPNMEYTAVYAKQNKRHPTYSYYEIIAIRSDNLLDLKKALKIHSLKAFL